MLLRLKFLSSWSNSDNNCSMSPLQYIIFLGQVYHPYQIFSCALVVYFKIIPDYVCCSLWVRLSMDQFYNFWCITLKKLDHLLFDMGMV